MEDNMPVDAPPYQLHNTAPYQLHNTAPRQLHDVPQQPSDVSPHQLPNTIIEDALKHLAEPVNKDLIKLVREMVLREYRVDDIDLVFKRTREVIKVYYVAGGTEICIHNGYMLHNRAARPYRYSCLYKVFKAAIPYFRAIAQSATFSELWKMHRDDNSGRYIPDLSERSDGSGSHFELIIDFGECEMLFGFTNAALSGESRYIENGPIWKHGDKVHIKMREDTTQGMYNTLSIVSQISIVRLVESLEKFVRDNPPESSDSDSDNDSGSGSGSDKITEV
jgi:hypothetical protein